MENIILIGMPSSGKSTAGVLLAKLIGFGFIDCDLVIQAEEQMRLPEIIEKHGVERFMEIEDRVCSGVMASRCVIATGGSVIYYPHAMEHLRSIGTVVFLKLDVTEIERRIPDLVKRGVLMKGDVTTIRELFDEREPLYERYADITIDCNHKNIDQLVAAIANAVGLPIE